MRIPLQLTNIKLQRLCILLYDLCTFHHRKIQIPISHLFYCMMYAHGIANEITKSSFHLYDFKDWLSHSCSHRLTAAPEADGRYAEAYWKGVVDAEVEC